LLPTYHHLRLPSGREYHAPIRCLIHTLRTLKSTFVISLAVLIVYLIATVFNTVLAFFVSWLFFGM